MTIDVRPGWHYAPQVFNKPSLRDAKDVILTPEQGLSPDQRWERETMYLLSQIKFDHHEMVVDYGCGIGRMAKVLVGNPVLGVDISPTMRANAEAYVQRPDFGVVCPPMLQCLVRAGFRAGGAIAVWCLQHCYDPEGDIRFLMSALSPNAEIWIVNRNHRAVPATDGAKFTWLDDGIDVFKVVEQFAAKHSEQPMPEHLCAPGAFLSCWIRTAKPVDWDAPRTVERGTVQ